MADKRQRKPTKKVCEFFSNVKKIIKRKASQELTSGKSGKRPTAVVSDAKDSDSPSIVPMEEEALHSDEDVVEVVPEDEDESSDSELERLKKEWNSPIYAFYHPVPDIGYHEGRRYHEFKCAATSCKKGVRHYLNKKDAKSTSNMRKHAKLCWGKETVNMADETKNANEAHTIISGAKNGSIMASFERKEKGKVIYSHRQHTRTETKLMMATELRLSDGYLRACDHSPL
ncbi:hypothetical protein DFJ58DRAFT_845357 [Suillus subalutaceus]|uniref:uncharacterized protein n=1 Tax=Suillus subalutaceus TaxID=48586 RepID=UPI001B872CF2|nr:uncharacterized protein DFJ58DRAFT_845357 [Suillus subalutaceus]KAG1840504.1 hypothetical protein DFJ58DRAFT_845357 [Suillus subalutaceus]